MANVSCSACEDLRQTDPNLIVNGFGDDECVSLQNNTGLVASSGHEDFEDLNDMNDCFVGNMATEIDSYDVCNWKDFMKKFIPNLWTTLKGIICSLGGAWTKIECIYQSLVNLADAIGGSVGGQSFVRYYRDNSGQAGDQYYWDGTTDSSHILDIYMDCDVDNPGTKAADRDYVVMISNCTDFRHPSHMVLDLTFYSSGDTTPIETLRLRRAQHPSYVGARLEEFSWTTSGAVLIKKGEHVKAEGHVYYGNEDAQYRLHQFVLTWIPINVSTPIDPEDILEC